MKFAAIHSSERESEFRGITFERVRERVQKAGVKKIATYAADVFKTVGVRTKQIRHAYKLTLTYQSLSFRILNS